MINKPWQEPFKAAGWTFREVKFPGMRYPAEIMEKGGRWAMAESILRPCLPNSACRAAQIIRAHLPGYTSDLTI